MNRQAVEEEDASPTMLIHPAKEPEVELPGTVKIHTPHKTGSFLTAERLLGDLRLLWSERRVLYRVAAWGLALVTAVAFLIPKRYESTTRLMPPDNQSSNMAMLAAMSAKTDSALGSMASSLLGLRGSQDLFIGILQSRTLQDRLVDRFDLKRVYGERLSMYARKELAEHTVIFEERKSGIITITVTDRDPQRAAAMGRAYVEELNRLVTELSTSGAHRERVFLEERLKAVKEDLESAEKDFSEFSSKNMAIDLKEQGKAMVTAAATLQGELIATESGLEGLRQIYTNNNVRVRSMQARISELKQQLEKIGGKGDSATGNSADDSLYPSIKKLPLLGVTYADMYRRTKVQEAVFEALTREYELAKVEEAKEIPSVKVLDVADVPEKKSFPPRLVIVILGTLLSFSFAATWILGNAYWRQLSSSNSVKFVALGVWAGTRANLQQTSENGGRSGWLARRLQRFGSPRRPAL